VVLGAANVNSQVRIGGDEIPNGAAVLDLNADDDATPTGNKGALALPRISLEGLSGEDANLNGTAPIAGMLVYNTNTTLGEGVYFWDGNEWVKSAGGSIYEGSTSIVLSGNSFQRAALTGDVTSPENSNITTIANNAVTTAHIATNAISSDHIATAAVTFEKSSLTATSLLHEIPVEAGSSAEITLPSPCNRNNTVIQAGCCPPLVVGWVNHTTLRLLRVATGFSTSVNTIYLCWP